MIPRGAQTAGPNGLKFGMGGGDAWDSLWIGVTRPSPHRWAWQAKTHKNPTCRSHKIKNDRRSRFCRYGLGHIGPTAQADMPTGMGALFVCT